MNLIKLQTKAHCYCDANIQAIAKSLVCDVPKEFKCTFVEEVRALFQKGTMTWFTYTDPTPSQKAVTEAVIKNPAIAEKCMHNLFNGAKGFEAFLKKINNLSQLSNKQLWELYHDYFTKYRELYLWGEPIAILVKDHLAEYLLQKIKNKGYLNLLVSPNYISFIKREEMELLQIAIKIKENPTVKNKLIKEHTARWRWIPYDYGVTTWNEEHFLNELKKIKNPEEELKKSNDYHTSLRKKQEIVTKKLNVDNHTRALVEAQKTIAILMDYKKEVFTKAHLAFRPLIREIGKRLGLSLNQAKSLLNSEVKDALLHNKRPDKGMIKRRIHFSILKVDERGNYAYLPEKEANEIYRELANGEHQKATVLTGYPASPGKVTGRVCIITNARNIKRLKKGEILVTYMTSPDYTAGMKIAAAIITDEGGITSHAAIVSRELGIPCVIGTKNATSALKDGDIVEVDATKGKIKVKNA